MEGVMAGITQKSSVAAFALCSLHKQNDWVKRRKNNMKDIILHIGYYSVVYWRFHLR